MLIADANYLYRDAMLANDMLSAAKKSLPPEEIAKARSHLYDTTKAVFGLGDPVSPQLQARGAKGFITAIAGQGSPKQGFFHGKVLKKPQDLSGRGTAVPDLNLNMDEVGLPEDMMWSMYAPHIVRGLVQKGYRAMEAKDMVDNRHPAAHDVLMAEAKQRPVLVNRAPTLHRFGIVGAYAVPVSGKSIRVNPFMEKGMNMDYDGDALQIHVPATDAAMKEMRSMTMSNLLFGDKTRTDLMVFPQHEAVLGVHHATQPGTGDSKDHKFKTKEEAVAAYRRGDVKITDTIQIG